ncbi:MAG: endonuclease/exonuclease/phosphatase family protein [Oscillospiraceae bacterium]|jgi:endonuclease/exonuclease/phosphatase family metal-dependent hydrolase|nr:endonuclease/exonuclease/phosphatase family protein [Oscillospiraceae bacterium]
MIMPEWLMNALATALSWLLVFTSSGSMAVYDPPGPPEVPDTPDTLAQEITVLSFNVYTQTSDLERRMNGVVQTILNETPDSFGLQEAHDIWRGRLKQELKGQYAVACDVGRMFGVHEGTPIFYRKDKYQLVDQGVFWLSDRPCVPSKGWDCGGLPRITGWAVLRDRETGFTYAHFNTHFDNAGAIARTNSARLVADRINALGLPTVLTGDLNAAPGSTPMQYLEAGGLADLRKAAAETDTGGTFHGYRGGSGILDYIYANHYLRGAAEFKVIRDEYDGMYPSDHFAICARLTLAN